MEIDNGIVVDQYCRTNIEGIFAAGDVANHYHPVFEQRMRVDHWHNALNQGQAAARNMLGKNLAYDEIHWCHRLLQSKGTLVPGQAARARRSMVSSLSRSGSTAFLALIRPIDLRTSLPRSMPHGGVHKSTLDVERNEIPLCQAAADDDLIPVSVEARVLEVVFVLVRPEPTTSVG